MSYQREDALQRKGTVLKIAKDHWAQPCWLAEIVLYEKDKPEYRVVARGYSVDEAERKVIGQFFEEVGL